MATPVDLPPRRARQQKGQTEPLSLRQPHDGPPSVEPPRLQSPPSEAGASHVETLPLSSSPGNSARRSTAAFEPGEGGANAGALSSLPTDHPVRRAATTLAPSTQPTIRRPGRDIRGLVLDDRYELLHRVARGGMGEVYVARHLSLDTLVAIKVMLADVAMVAGYQQRFQREARAMSLLNHRNIVRVLDFGFHDSMPYIVMELLNGRTLSEWLYHLNGLPSLHDVDEIMRGIFSAFEAAHNVGIVHRDLKPDNVFLSIESDGQRVIKVLDFGLARIEGPVSSRGPVTSVEVVSGTPEYMSPEQCRSLSVTPLADLYSMGCLLTELLQGFPPFGGASHVDIMTKQMFVAPPPLVRPDGAEPVPLLLDRVRRELLAKNPRRRPQSVAELRDRWDEALNRERAQQRLPPRKSPQPMGERSARQQDWTNPVAPSPHGAFETQQVVGILRYADDPDGINDNCILGLAGGGMAAQPFEAAASPASVDAVVIDAGDHIDAACEWLMAAWPEVRDKHLARPVVCVRYVDAAVLNRLIVAGAGDVVVYPVEVVTLARKVRRALRKAWRLQARASTRPPPKS